MGVAKNNGGVSRAARQNVQPINGGKGSGRVPQLASAASKGSGSKGSLSELTRQTHKGSSSKGGMAKKLASGTHKTGKTPFPSMAKGPLR